MAVVHARCQYCAREFCVRRPDGRYCSEACRFAAEAQRRHERWLREAERRKQQRPERACLRCGRSFQPKQSPQRYCSTTCRDVATCPKCGRAMSGGSVRCRACYQASRRSPPAPETSSFAQRLARLEREWRERQRQPPQVAVEWACLLCGRAAPPGQRTCAACGGYVYAERVA